MFLQDTLRMRRSLAVRINPRPFIYHKLRVLDYLRLEDGCEPDGISSSEWKDVLDYFENDASTAIQRGVYYLPGDVVEVSRLEASDLLSVFPSYFEPVDDLSVELSAAINRGEI